MKKLTKREKKERKGQRDRLKAHAQEAIDKLFNANPIEHMRRINELKSDIGTYFYSSSPVWRAIKEHIGDSNIETCAVIQLEGRVAAQGGSDGLSFKDWFAYHKGDIFRMEFTVTYYDNYIDYYNWDSFDRSYNVLVPIDLELNFTKKKFKAWLAGIKKARDENTKAGDLKELARLQKKYPKGK